MIEEEEQLKQLTTSIELLGSYLDSIHNACGINNKNEFSDHILSIIDHILKETLKETCNSKDYHNVIDFLDIIVIPKLQTILDIVYVLEKIPWRAKDNDVKVGDRIPPPPLILSISHFRIIYTIVEILWSWGIQSYLNTIIEFKLVDNIFPKTLLLTQNEIECMIPYIKENNESKCFKCITIMGSILSNKLFKATMLKRNLKRMILSLLILTSCTSSKEQTQFKLDEESLKLAQTLLDNFTINFPERVMVIKDLRSASRGPQFLRNAACSVMTKILLSPQGLETVLVGYLEGLPDDDKTLPLQMNVAKLITAIPMGYNKNSYIASICVQLVQLMSLGSKKEDQILMKVCIMIINRIAQTNPLLCDKCLVESFAEPLMRLGLNDEEIKSSDASNVDDIVTSEEEVDSTIRIIHNIINIAPLTPALTSSISRTGLGKILLAMYCQTSKFAKSCHWLLLLQNFSIQYLCNLEPSVSSEELRQVILFSTKNKVSSAMNGGICIKQGSPDHINSMNITKNKQNHTQLTPESILQFKKNESLMEESSNVENYDMDLSELQKIEEMIMNITSNISEELYDSKTSNDLHANLFTGQRMMFVGNRAKVITDLLLRIEKILSSVPEASTEEKENSQEQSNSVASKLFITTLQSFLGINNVADSEGDIDEENLKYDKITGDGLLRGLDGLIVVTLQGHCEMSMLLRNGIQVIKLLSSFLQSHLQYLENNVVEVNMVENNVMIEDLDESEDVDRKETCSTVLSLLASILALGNSTRPIEEENELKSLLMPLQRISMKEKDQSIAQAASDTAFMILNRAAGGHNNKCNDKMKKTIEQTIIESKEYMNSASPAMRSYAIRLISMALYENEKNDEVIQIVFEILYTMLNDSDSFVYLHVLQVLTRLADFNRQNVFDALLCAFQSDLNGNTEDSTSLPERRRSLIGEALSSILRRSGDIAPKFVPFIVVACIKIIKKRLNDKDDNRIEELIDLRSMKITPVHNNTIENEDDFIAKRKNERKNEKNEKKIIKAALSADNVLLRQSAVSLLAEAISTAGWSAANYMLDTLDIAVGILTFETKSTQTNRSIRR